MQCIMIVLDEKKVARISNSRLVFHKIQNGVHGLFLSDPGKPGVRSTVDQILNQSKLCHQVAKFAANASGAMLLPNLVQVMESISGYVVPLAMFI